MTKINKKFREENMYYLFGKKGAKKSRSLYSPCIYQIKGGLE